MDLLEFQQMGRQRFYGFHHVDVALKIGKTLLDLPAEAKIYKNAIATPREFEYLTDVENYGKRTYTGAVFDSDGEIIPECLRTIPGGVFMHRPEPRELVQAGEKIRQRKKSVYLGSMMGHFGHFLLEVLPRVWILDHHPDAEIYFHPWRTKRKDGSGFPTEALSAAAGRDVQIRLIKRPIQFDQLIMPSPIFLINRGGSREFGDWCGGFASKMAVKAPAGDRPPLIYYSRSKLSDSKRQVANEAWLEAYFAAKGFAIVHPQDHSLAEQMAMMRSCKVLAGTLGSAMHQALFLPRGSSVINIDSYVLPSQNGIETVCDHRALHLFAVGIRGTSLWAYEERMNAWSGVIDDMIASA